jgi:short-subunit dehydrogenase
LDKLNDVASGLRANGAEVETRIGDAARPDDIADLVTELSGSEGGPDVLHYNAAVKRQAGILALPPGAFAEDAMVDVGGALTVIQEAVPAIRERGSGTILLTGGALALQPSNDVQTLSLGKAGPRALAQATFEPLRRVGLHIATVTAGRTIRPGSIDAAGVADRFWELHAQPADAWDWESAYP